MCSIPLVFYFLDFEPFPVTLPCVTQEKHAYFTFLLLAFHSFFIGQSLCYMQQKKALVDLNIKKKKKLKHMLQPLTTKKIYWISRKVGGKAGMEKTGIKDVKQQPEP